MLDIVTWLFCNYWDDKCGFVFFFSLFVVGLSTEHWITSTKSRMQGGGTENFGRWVEYQLFGGQNQDLCVLKFDDLCMTMTSNMSV